MSVVTDDPLLKKLGEGSDRILDKWAEDAEKKKAREEREAEEATREPASAERLKSALETGGRALVTVRSKKTGQHVSLRLAAKKKRPGGRGYVSRGTSEGRVGTKEADAIFVDDPTLTWPEGKVGIFYLRTGEWRPTKKGDPARVWSAEKAIFWALSSFDLEAHAEIFIELRCSFCGHALRDPVSIERGIGPECYGRHTGSRSASRA